MTFKKISVIGLGYIGLPTAAIFSNNNLKVIGVDINQSAIDIINQGKIHIIEPGLESMVENSVKKGFLKASKDAESAEAFLIAVPTPFKGTGHKPDLSYIKEASKAIAKVLKSGDLVILESTVPVGTTEKMSEWLAEYRPDLTFPQSHYEQSDIRIAHCPERVLPGKVLEELVSNDRVIGGMTPKCSQLASDLYNIFLKGKCILTNARTAELCKLTENSFRDVNIAFANELSIICDQLDINVWELISLANRHPRVNILQPGPGVGGHCIAVDPWFIVDSAPQESKLIKTARLVNDYKPTWVIEKIKLAIAEYLQKFNSKNTHNISIAFYGLSFKPDIDDLRESPAISIFQEIAKTHNGPIIAIEPNITALPKYLQSNNVSFTNNPLDVSADISVILVNHKIFYGLNIQTHTLIDTKGIY